MLTIRDVTAVKQVSHRASFVTSKFLITLSFVCHYKSKVGTLPIMNLCVHISSGNKISSFSGFILYVYELYVCENIYIYIYIY